MAEQYNLNVGVFPLVGGTAGHVVIAATDPRGNIIFEAQGLATGPDGQRKAIGGPLDRTDTIDAYVDNGAFLFPDAVNRRILFTGSLEEIKLYRAALEEAAVRINAKDLDYGPMGVFGANSNSVGHTFLKLLGFDMTAKQLTKKALPGFSKILLSPKELDAIQKMEFDIKCFPANTPIQTSLTSTTQISDLRVGDVVLAFDPDAELGRGALVPRRVTRLFHNTTTEWIKLTWLDPVTGEAKELVATPGHEMLDKSGGFARLDALVQGNTCEIILSSGDCIMAQAERLVYTSATADQFERATVMAATSGALAMAPQSLDAWATYNFEVEDLHTYVAGGVGAAANVNCQQYKLAA
jgi:hypothetical protein